MIYIINGQICAFKFVKVISNSIKVLRSSNELRTQKADPPPVGSCLQLSSEMVPFSVATAK